MTHRPRKRFGQNFLHDPAIIGRIIAAINPQAGEHLVEIGPGRGAITLPLLRAAGQLTVIEIDRDLIAPLRARAGEAGTLDIINDDALAVDYCRLGNGRPLRVVGNLPYNISTPLLFHLLEQHTCIHDMHFMLQKEVVQRMAAAPGGGSYGRLSVMLQYRCRVTPLFSIAPGAFTPAPKVDSAFVRLQPHATAPVTVHNEQQLAQLVRQAFSQRRKTLRNTLRGLLDEEMIRDAGIDPARRAETLSLEEFAKLADRVGGN